MDATQPRVSEWLDFTLPDLDGIQVTTRLREWSVAPILILSAALG